ncbi:hypothetical protein Tco_1335390 [Tanacetum coccineum]
MLLNKDDQENKDESDLKESSKIAQAKRQSQKFTTLMYKDIKRLKNQEFVYRQKAMKQTVECIEFRMYFLGGSFTYVGSTSGEVKLDHPLKQEKKSALRKVRIITVSTEWSLESERFRLMYNWSYRQEVDCQSKITSDEIMDTS